MFRHPPEQQRQSFVLTLDNRKPIHFLRDGRNTKCAFTIPNIFALLLWRHSLAVCCVANFLLCMLPVKYIAADWYIIENKSRFYQMIQVGEHIKQMFTQYPYSVINSCGMKWLIAFTSCLKGHPFLDNTITFIKLYPSNFISEIVSNFLFFFFLFLFFPNLPGTTCQAFNQINVYQYVNIRQDTSIACTIDLETHTSLAKMNTCN